MEDNISLEHLAHLTDDVGIIQHAIYNLPRRVDGYATDDNARALVLAVRHYSRNPSAESLKLAQTYLAFLQHSQSEGGEFHTFMTYDRRWKSIPLSQDCHARCLWGCAETMASKAPADIKRLSKELLERGFSQINSINSPRAVGLNLLAFSKAWTFEEKEEYLRLAESGAQYLVQRFRDAADDQWRWFEDYITYGNARIPQGLFCAGMLTGNREYIEIAEKSFLFLDRATNMDGIFVPVGNHGWLDKTGKRAIYDQQPLEAGTMVEAAADAYRATGNETYLKIARRAFNWFTGKNTINTPVANISEGSCCDGIQEEGLNMNKGAEATISFCMAALCMNELGLPLMQKAEKID